MHHLPSGTLTLMFTDIEGSSRRWEDDPDTMRAALAAHDEVVTTTVPEFEGTVIKHTGDGFSAVFRTAIDAARAAIEIQRHLQRDAWPHGDRLAVRIGLHTGDLVPTEGDYFGPVANRAARTMDVANGNQIACSATTVQLLEGIDTRTEGHHELRGIGVEEIFVVSSDELLVDDRPLRLPVEPSNLPATHTSFVGRDADMKLVTEFLRGGSRLVSLLGPGGIGKTRLAIEVGAALRADYAGGVHFCDLASVGEADAVADAVAESIGARRQPGMSLAESIVDFAENRELLVIVDNCEHLIDAVRQLLEQLIGADGLTTLTTTREAVGIPGEQLVVLAPLEPDGAGVELFAQRGREGNPSFRLDESTEADVLAIVRKVDGIPLAIELAAAWLRVMPPAELVGRLDDRFRLLRGGRRGERHETLRDTVRWSYDLLGPAEATLFRRLCVFGGGFPLAAAETVCADGDAITDDEVADLLMALVDKSMVAADTSGGSGRFTMLETLRRFGEEELAASGESLEFRTRHAHWALDLADQQRQRLFTAAEPDAWSVLDREWDNLRIAMDTLEAQPDLDRAATLVESLVWFGVFSMRFELFAWAGELLDLDGVEESDHYTNLCGAAAMRHYFTADPRAVELAELGLAADPSDPEGFCRTTLAAVYLNNVHSAEASSALTRDWLAHDPATTGNRLWAHGFRTFHLCTFEPGAPEAIDHADATMAIARRTGSPTALALAYWAEGQTVAIDDRDVGAQVWRDGLEWARSLPTDHLVEHLLVGLLLHFQARRGDLSQVLELCESAIRSALRSHYLTGASHLLGVTAIALARAGDPDTAARLLGAMVANGHLPRGNAQRALEEAHGDQLEARMAPGRALSVSQAARAALDALSAARERVG